MFSDTHFHLHHIWERGLDVPAALQSMAAHKPLFGLDIGTHCDDLFPRAQKAQELVKESAVVSKKKKAAKKDEAESAE